MGVWFGSQHFTRFVRWLGHLVEAALCLPAAHPSGPNWLTPSSQAGRSEIAPPAVRGASLGHHTRRRSPTSPRRLPPRGSSLPGLLRLWHGEVRRSPEDSASPRLTSGPHRTRREEPISSLPRIARRQQGRGGSSPTTITPTREKPGDPAESVAARPRAPTRACKGCHFGAAPPARAHRHPRRRSAFHAASPAAVLGRAKDLEKIAKYLLPENRIWALAGWPGGVGRRARTRSSAPGAGRAFPASAVVHGKDRELLPTEYRRCRTIV